MAISSEGIYINTISGGIVNFGGAGTISPISITNTTAGSGQSNSGASVSENGSSISPNGTTSLNGIASMLSRTAADLGRRTR